MLCAVLGYSGSYGVAMALLRAASFLIAEQSVLIEPDHAIDVLAGV